MYTTNTNTQATRVVLFPSRDSMQTGFISGHASPPAAKKPCLELSVHPDNWPALNPLQYSAKPVQYASSPQPGNTQTTDVADADQPKQTLERREAMGYQRELED
ncbi:hypothetical protein FRC12_008641 [Ceratobasidium sp. 428]|nr:hypothetical protein FRC12_008641 [Ceratobasidium sp. 428]